MKPDAIPENLKHLIALGLLPKVAAVKLPDGTTHRLIPEVIAPQNQTNPSAPAVR